MSDWTGYRGTWRFADWENELLTVKTPPVSGVTMVSRATNVPAKADGEKGGLQISEAGTVTVQYTRVFFFAASYRNAAGATLDPRSDGGVDLLDEGNELIDADGKHWTILTTRNPGGADEHYEVHTVRRMS